jgi:hypothetical protein
LNLPSGGKARGITQGMSVPSTSLTFPVAKLNWYTQDTIFYIQNAGNSAATATAVFYMGNSAVGTNAIYTYTTPSVNPGQMVVISPADARDSLNNPIPTVPSGGNGVNDGTKRANLGGALITSSQPLAGAYAEYYRGNVNSVNMTRALITSDRGTKAYAPNVKRWWYSRWTGIAVQNVDTVPITVTASLVGTGQYAGSTCLGGSYTDTLSNIPPGQSSNFLFYNAAGYTNLPNYCLAAATLNGTGQFVAVANENNIPGTPAGGSVYYIMSDGSATTNLAAPWFVDQRTSNGVQFDGGLLIQNVDAITATNVIATFYNCSTPGTASTPFTATSKSLTISPGGSFLFWRPYSYLPVKNQMASLFQYNNVECGVLVTGDRRLVGMYNEVSVAAGAADDASFELFNQ